MIIVRLEGGLGNSMFQYALGRSISIKNRTDLKFDIESYKTNPLADCSFWLESFTIDISTHLATSAEITRFKKFETRLGKKWVLRNWLYADKTKYVKEKYYHFDPQILKLQGGDLYLHGWWQSEKYFSDIRHILLRDFTLRSPLSDQNEQVAEKIRSTNSIGIHIRRQDYVANPKTRNFHGELSKEYYDEALAFVTAKVENPMLFVFSDDIPWAREHMRFPHDTIYVGWNTGGTGAEDLFLLSLCKHAITGNSSFSWWGAWLNQNPKKIVVAPEKWIASSKQNTKDVVPKTWTTIPVNYLQD